VIEDCSKIIQLDPQFGKAYYRKAQALLALCRFEEAVQTCRAGLEEAKEESLAKVLEAAEERLTQETARSNQKKEALSSQNQGLRQVLESKGVSYSAQHSADIQRQFQPIFRAENGKLSTSIIVFYSEFQQMDFIQIAQEDESLFDHIACVLEEGLPWDTQKHYLDINDIAIYLFLQKRELFCGNQCSLTHPRMVEVPATASILDALMTKDYVVPGCLEVFVVSTKSPFHKHFLTTHK
jgi:tetratricopeptide (TPR) repeat protein